MRRRTHTLESPEWKQGEGSACEDRVLDGPASGERGSKGRNELEEPRAARPQTARGLDECQHGLTVGIWALRATELTYLRGLSGSALDASKPCLRRCPQSPDTHTDVMYASPPSLWTRLGGERGLRNLIKTPSILANAWAHTWAHGGLATRRAAPTARLPAEPESRLPPSQPAVAEKHLTVNI